FAMAIQSLVFELVELKASSLAIGPARPKPSLLHFNKYSGELAELDAWLYTAKAKFYVDGYAISDLEVQFYYFYSSLLPPI
ncbi:hypothetical protein B0H65DRAFT_436161, partial [Neurospora tetraspora]